MLTSTVDTSQCSGQLTSLHIASKSNFKECVKVLLQHKASVTMKDNKGRTPLYLAASHGNFDIVKVIVTSTNLDLITDMKVHVYTCNCSVDKSYLTVL